MQTALWKNLVQLFFKNDNANDYPQYISTRPSWPQHHAWSSELRPTVLMQQIGIPPHKQTAPLPVKNDSSLMDSWIDGLWILPETASDS